jgi:hypothetical protein
MSPLIDPRLAFLACASARLALFESGAIDLDEAVDRAFIERFRRIAGLTCHCDREILAVFEREYWRLAEQQLRDWRWSRS